jgi:hypothetical protein
MNVGFLSPVTHNKVLFGSQTGGTQRRMHDEIQQPSKNQASQHNQPKKGESSTNPEALKRGRKPETR